MSYQKMNLLVLEEPVLPNRIEWDEDIRLVFCEKDIETIDDKFDDEHQFLNYEHKFVEDDNEYK